MDPASEIMQRDINQHVKPIDHKKGAMARHIFATGDGYPLMSLQETGRLYMHLGGFFFPC